jgi:hypothetical protein
MAPQHRITFTVGEDVMGVLRKIKERDGISEAEQASEALRLWCESHDVQPDTKDLMRQATRIWRRIKRTQAKETSSRSK